MPPSYAPPRVADSSRWREAADTRGIRVRSFSQVGTGAAAASVLVALAFSSGGYPPSEHGQWILVFALVVLSVGLVADGVTLDRRSLALPGALAALAVWALVSAVWSPAVAWPELEAERMLLYAAAAGALVLVVTRERVSALLTGLVAGATVVALFALATRLFPGKIGGAYDPSAGYQLAEPIGYSNALGATLVLGLLLATGLALRGGPVVRLTAASTLVPLAVGLYFTFSRGAVLALLAGVVVLLSLERLTLPGLPALWLAPAAGILLASRSPALTRAGEPLAAAQEQGARLAWQITILAAGGAAAAWALHRLEGRVHVPLPRGRGLVAAAAVLVGVSVFGLVRVGGPVAAVESAKAAFTEDAPPASDELDGRLLSVSGHGRATIGGPHLAWSSASRCSVTGPGASSAAGSRSVPRRTGRATRTTSTWRCSPSSGPSAWCCSPLRSERR